jgi:hypothetical protein
MKYAKLRLHRDQTYELWALKKEKRCKLKKQETYLIK